MPLTHHGGRQRTFPAFEIEISLDSRELCSLSVSSECSGAGMGSDWAFFVGDENR